MNFQIKDLCKRAEESTKRSKNILNRGSNNKKISFKNHPDILKVGLNNFKKKFNWLNLSDRKTYSMKKSSKRNKNKLKRWCKL